MAPGLFELQHIYLRLLGCRFYLLGVRILFNYNQTSFEKFGMNYCLALIFKKYIRRIILNKLAIKNGQIEEKCIFSRWKVELMEISVCHISRYQEENL